MILMLDRRKKHEAPKVWPNVTVAIPAYNEEKTIRRTIESVLALDYPKDKLEIQLGLHHLETKIYGLPS